MKRFNLLAVIAGLVLLACSLVAHAGDDYSPLQPAHAGNWFDPAQAGSGFDILPYPVPHTNGAAFVTFYSAGTAASLPTWFAAQASWSGPGPVSAPLYASTDQGAQIVGSVTITASGSTCSALHADVTVGSNSRHFDLVPLIQPDAAQCHVCRGEDFSPLPPGCY